MSTWLRIIFINPSPMGLMIHEGQQKEEKHLDWFMMKSATLLNISLCWWNQKKALSRRGNITVGACCIHLRLIHLQMPQLKQAWFQMDGWTFDRQAWSAPRLINVNAANEWQPNDSSSPHAENAIISIEPWQQRVFIWVNSLFTLLTFPNLLW